MTLIRTTMQPDVEIEVGDAELLDLQRDGLIAPDPTPAAKAEDPTPTAPAPAAKKAVSPAATKEG